MAKNRVIDHIVYCVPDLDEAIESIGSALGIYPVFGGYHKTQGTKNALLNLREGCYLELLASDDKNLDFRSNRWMGIDLITEPKVTRWALKSDDIETDSAILKLHNPEMGTIFKGSRLTTDNETLAWSMTLPLPKPEVDIMPFMVDWSDSSFHPTDKLEAGCTLKEISFVSNTLDKDIATFEKLNLDYIPSQGSTSRIRITIAGPNGEVRL